MQYRIITLILVGMVAFSSQVVWAKNHKVDYVNSQKCDIGDTEPPIDESCTLEESGPIAATYDGQVIEGLRITSFSGPAILVDGFKDVIIRDVEIFHEYGMGISFLNADRLRIENVNVVHTGAPKSGENDNAHLVNIHGVGSDHVVIHRARLSKGSGGIYLLNSDFAQLSFIQGHDFRGPSPRGQLVQFNMSNDCLLEDFSVENPETTSMPQDNVSVFWSSRCLIRRGLIDGNNSPAGVGVMVEHRSGDGDVLIEDVDAIRMGNGCFGGVPGNDVTYRGVRCRENICGDQGRGLPLSGGLAFISWKYTADFMSSTSFVEAEYFALCNPHAIGWNRSEMPIADFTENDFIIREPIRLKFCWE